GYARLVKALQERAVEVGVAAPTEATPEIRIRRNKWLVGAIGVAILILASFLIFNGRLFNPLPPSTITISFDAWSDLGRMPTNRNKVMLGNTFVAPVIYGSRQIDVRQIDLASVRL